MLREKLRVFVSRILPSLESRRSSREGRGAGGGGGVRTPAPFPYIRPCK